MTVKKAVFRPSFGNRPDQLLGRDAIMDQVTEGLQSFPGSAERSLLLIGQRGMGKTALLLEIADRAKELDYVAVRVTCGESMLDNLVELLQREGSRYIKESGRSVKGVSAGALGFSFGLTFTEEAQRSFGFRVKLEMICEKLSKVGKRVLILADEVTPSVAGMRELAAAYQELAGTETDIAIVMAGLPAAVSDLLNYKTLTFLNRAQRIVLEMIPIHEVELYYQSAFSRASIKASPEIIKEAAEATEGFPYQIQLVGHYLSKVSAGGKNVSRKMLLQALDAVTGDIDSKVFHAMINPLSDLDISFLTVIAEHDGIIKTADIGELLHLGHGTVQTYRKRLLDAGVISAPRRGELVFVFPQLADYLRRRG